MRQQSRLDPGWNDIMASPSSPVRLTSDHRGHDILSEPVYDPSEDAERLALTATQIAESNSIVSQALSQRNTIDELLGRGDPAQQQSGTFLWGTFVNTADTLKTIWLFFTTFKKDPNDSAPYYVQLIEKVRLVPQLSERHFALFFCWFFQEEGLRPVVLC